MGSGMATDALAANLQGLRMMVHGGPDAESGVGFDDLLAENGCSDIADVLLADIDAAIAEAEAFEEPLQTVIVSDMERVVALHGAVKRVTDTLKGPFVMCLMLTVPMEGAGDAD
jgi:hypothetical protein